MLTDALKREFSGAFAVLEAAIASFSPEQWRRGSPPFNGPGRAVAHVLQCAEFYTTQDRAAFANLGKKVSQMADADVPPQEQMLRYAAEVRRMTMAWIDSMGDAGLAAPRPRPDAQELIGLDCVVYALRHLQHHAGEVCAYQKQCGLEPAPWK